uniref:Uncharacterized protein n=1 Tax=Arundo donax TaxID=35708 RepID=A0A0A9FKZ6_ARUDO
MIEEIRYRTSARTMDSETCSLNEKENILNKDHLKSPLPPVAPVDDGKPDLPRPDPMSIVVPMYHGAAGPFSSNPSLSCPTTPTSERSTFFGAVIFKSINPRLKESAHTPDLTWKAPFFTSGFDVDIEAGSSFVGNLFVGMLPLAAGDSVYEVKAPKFSSSKGLRSELLTPPGGSCLDSARPEPIFEENAPKKSDLSKLFIETAGKGSKSVALEC